MEQVRKLHHALHRAINEQHTKECLAIIDCLYQESCHIGKEGIMNQYSHAHCLLTPLAHAIAKDNAVVALNLLEKGCNPTFCVNRYSHGKNNVPSWHKFLFNVIGKFAFAPVLVKILEVIKEPVFDENSNTVLHIICQKKLTPWLQIVLNSPSQHYLLFHANNQGCLPMHIAAKVNFLEFFNLVFRGVSSCFKHCAGNEQLPTAERVLFQKVRECKQEDKSKSHVYLVKEETYAKESTHSKYENKGGRTLKYQIGAKKLMMNTNCKSTMHHQSKNSCLRNIDINSPILGKGETVLHIAVQCKFKELVNVLLEMGANVNVSRTNVCSPLFCCMNSNKDEKDTTDTDVVDVCRHLITAGADVNQYSRSHSFFRSIFEDDIITPLHLAAKTGRKDVVELLLNNAADPKATSKKLCKLPLQMALEEDQTESAIVLLNQTLYPDRYLAHFTDKASNTLLHSAGNCHEEIIIKVMNLGCSLDQPNVNNVFPLDRAIFFGNIPYIHAILSSRPEIVNVTKNLKACPPLHFAATSALEKLPLCQILLTYGADIYAKAYGKNMAYRRALRNDCYKNVVYLCELMSRPFTSAERKELLECAESRMDVELALRLHCRLENVPSLLSYCLDVIRQIILKNSFSFKDIHSLPIPDKMVRALKYQDDIQC